MEASAAGRGASAGPPLPARAISRETARSWDRRAMEEYGIPGLVLMENAAQGSTALLLGLREREPRRWAAPPYHVIAGPGQNGGDGFAIARHLHNAGLAVVVHLVLPRSRTDPSSDAGVNLEVISRMGITLREPSRDAVPAAGTLAAGVIVDAMLGTGLARPLGSPYREWVELVNRSGLPVAAIDLPTGLDADTGEVLGAAVRADWTLTIAAPKLGFARGAGPAHVGRVEVVPISIPREVMASRP